MKEIFKCIVGSHLYGTNIETSDTDYKGIFILSQNDYLGLSYPKQIDHSKDYVSYEVGRFLQLLMTGNPNMIDLLFIPDEFVLSKDPLYNLILEHRNKFITKECKNSFVGYAISQIRRAKSLDKKLNWEKSKIERKLVKDFCYIVTPMGLTLFEDWLRRQRGNQFSSPDHYCLSKVNHGRDMYNLYWDENHVNGFYQENSNEVRVDSIPKEILPTGILYFNKDAYSQHCRDYNQYQEWLKTRNTDRYKESSVKEQFIDSKNLMHCRRLLDMAIDIATLGKVIPNRENTEELLKIRKGECNLQEVLNTAEKDVIRIEELFSKSSLPDKVDFTFVNNLLIKIRKWSIQ